MLGDSSFLIGVLSVFNIQDKYNHSLVGNLVEQAKVSNPEPVKLFQVTLKLLDVGSEKWILSQDRIDIVRYLPVLRLVLIVLDFFRKCFRLGDLVVSQ
jgi:hypothetical protein